VNVAPQLDWRVNIYGNGSYSIVARELLLDAQ
jgi:hypothetical protein